MRQAIKGKTLIIITAVFVLLVFLHSLKVLAPAEKYFFKIASPVHRAIYGFGGQLNKIWENLTYREDLIQTNLLRAQIRGLLVQNAKYKITEEENALLKKELGFSRTHDYELVAARIIGYDLNKTSNLLILQIENKNYNPADLKADMPVISEDGILIGKIASVNQDEIHMYLVTSSQSAAAAAVLNKDATIGVVEGELNFGLKMKMIPQSEKLKQGELVVTSGLENMMPKGLLLGTISKVEHDSLSPFDIAYITPLFDPKKLSKVMIIKKY